MSVPDCVFFCWLCPCLVPWPLEQFGVLCQYLTVCFCWLCPCFQLMAQRRCSPFARVDPPPLVNVAVCLWFNFLWVWKGWLFDCTRCRWPAPVALDQCAPPPLLPPPPSPPPPSRMTAAQVYVCVCVASSGLLLCML